mgnify:CR=1 FL=1
MNLKQIFRPRNVQAYLIIIVVFGLLADSSKAQSNAAIIWYTVLKLSGMLAVTFLPFVAKYEFLSPETRSKQSRAYAVATIFGIFVSVVVFGFFIYSNFYMK